MTLASDNKNCNKINKPCHYFIKYLLWIQLLNIDSPLLLFKKIFSESVDQSICYYCVHGFISSPPQLPSSFVLHCQCFITQSTPSDCEMVQDGGGSCLDSKDGNKDSQEWGTYFVFGDLWAKV